MQKPSVRPDRPSRPRPTGASQRLQNRRLSGTSGRSMIAEAGSRYGTGGTSTSPAPSIPRRADPVDPVPPLPCVPRVAVRPDDPRDPDPLGPEDGSEPGDAIAAGVVGETEPASGGADPGSTGPGSTGPGSTGPAATGADAAEPAAAGAIPHSSQKPSGWTLPGQPA
ncbi:hypothetical protein GCM10010191_47630 [Actinomadura vinacea]|uniref:Uncharacterized protein n=2 Tax=Actinomadura vinacea TaxID=115336 RepID=A0ABN3JG61_9ACTN